jgi:site-specific recombinase XerC
VHQLLKVVPNSPVGLRDRAVILKLVLTGRRRAEVLNMKAGNLIIDGDRAYYTFVVKVANKGVENSPNQH